MKSLWDESTRTAIAERVRSLTPDSSRQWGRMSPHQMLCHTADQLRMAMGEIDTAQAGGPLAFAPIRYVVIHVLPWPKGRAQAPPEAFTTTPGVWASDREALVELIDRFGRTLPDQLAPTHPIFGPLSGKDWAVLSYRHLDHHLRQFGA